MQHLGKDVAEDVHVSVGSAIPGATEESSPTSTASHAVGGVFPPKVDNAQSLNRLSRDCQLASVKKSCDGIDAAVQTSHHYVAQPPCLYAVQYLQLPNDPETGAYVGLPSENRPSSAVSSACRTGYSAIIYFTVIMCIGSFLLIAFGTEEPSNAILLLSLSLFPVVILFSAVQTVCGEYIFFPLMLEMFWAGVLISAPLAIALETLFQHQSQAVWRCQALNPSILCDISFVIVVVLSVGFAEELCKALPLCRFRVKQRDFPLSKTWWYRLAQCPQTFVLGGLCCSAGFATLENIGYVFRAGETLGVATSLWRAVLSIPFHIACTTYVACCLAQQQFLYSRCSTSLELTDIIDPPPELALLNPASASNIIELSGSLPPPCDRTEPNSSVPTGWFQKALLYFSSLLVPSLLHGFYDAGLFLALQLTKLSLGQYDHLVSIQTHSKTQLLPHLIPFYLIKTPTNTLPQNELPCSIFLSFLTRADFIEPDFKSEGNRAEVYRYLSILCLCISITCYTSMLSLAIKAYRNLPQFENPLANQDTHPAAETSLPHTLLSDNISLRPPLFRAGYTSQAPSLGYQPPSCGARHPTERIISMNAPLNTGRIHENSSNVFSFPASGCVVYSVPPRFSVANNHSDPSLAS